MAPPSPLSAVIATRFAAIKLRRKDAAIILNVAFFVGQTVVTHRSSL
jgi:hypothetical protein